MISLSSDVDDVRLRRYVKQQKFEWPQVQIGQKSQVASDYGIVGEPTYILVGPDGRVVSNSRDHKKIEEELRNLRMER